MKVLEKVKRIKDQIRSQLCNQLNVKILPNDDYDDPEAILKSLLSGFFTNVACRQDDAEGTYRNPRASNSDSSTENTLHIHPSSVLSNLKPRWVMYNEVVVTSKNYMRDVSAIQVEWLYEVAPHFYTDRRKQTKQD